MQGQVLKIAYAETFNHKLAQLRHLPLHQTHFEFEGELPIWNKFCELIAHTYIHSVRNYVLSLSGDNQAFDMKSAFLFDVNLLGRRGQSYQANLKCRIDEKFA